MRRIMYLPLLIAAMSALVGLAAPASSLAAGCPPGQSGTPPYCQSEPPKPPPTPTPTPPPPPLTAVAVANEVASGAVKVTFSVPGPGKVTLKGKAIKNLKINVTASGNIFVTLRPTGKVLQHLKNRGWTRRKRITVTFIGADGTKQTIRLVVRFRKP